jgi:SAM-dependent methyltransferase
VPSSDRPRSGWQSYDSVVDEYDTAAVPRFESVAEDLVAAVAPPAEGRIVDIGTGTGLAARLVRDRLGPAGFVAGVDPSLGMLERAAAYGLTVAAAALPGLPFAAGVFDAALANLVLSHIADYRAGLVDAVRVLRAGGRFGCSAWAHDEPGTGVSDAAEADDMLNALAGAHGLAAAPPEPPVPSEEPLRDRSTLEGALRAAGLEHVAIRAHTYQWSYSVDEYLVGRAWRPGVRYARERAGDRPWRELEREGAARLRERFGDTINSSGRLWIAVGAKP